MAKEPAVLVLGGRAIEDVSGRLLVLGFRALKASDADDARDKMERAGDDVCAALVDASMDLDEIRALRELAPRCEILAMGRRPEEKRIEALRKAGVRIGLFDPVDDGVLQFCLGQAALIGRGIEGRRHGRVPTDLTAVVRAKTGPRAVGIHEMSTSGAFLTTLRPLMRGATVPIELRLPEGVIMVQATVVWSNVIGNLRRDRHPTGMAVKFDPLSQADTDAVTRYLTAQLARFRL